MNTGPGRRGRGPGVSGCGFTMKKEPVSLFLDPPWKALFGSLTAMGICACLFLRLSELGGTHVQEACRVALLVSLAAGLCGLYPVLMALGGSGWNMLLGSFIGSIVRLMIVAAGFVSVVVFTQIHAIWLMVFCGAVYTVVLIVDTLLAIRLIRRKRWNEDEQ